jgi:formylglycine-generating enzyme required for sulfatase activity
MMRKLYALAITGLIAAPTAERALANWLEIQNIGYNQTTKEVWFDIRWRNSWRQAANANPPNWDAAWVFVKFRTCGTAANVAWTHGEISTTIAHHVIGGGLEPVLSDGSAVGIDPAPNNLGVMLRRNAVGKYVNAPWATCTLRVTNLDQVTGPLDVKVFGIEMVFIPQGPFFVGDGRFQTWHGGFLQTQITSEAAISIQAHHPAVTPWPSNTNISASYPKGFAPFHCMKYEITQGQYADFLNTIPAAAQLARYPGVCPYTPPATNCHLNRRYNLLNTGAPPDIYFAPQPDRAQNWLLWADISAYLDWACLRPMNELEFEKICRGPAAPVLDEYAWGSTSLTELTVMTSTTPLENGTEEALNADANCHMGGNNTVAGGITSSGQEFGPVRVGIFAKATTSGATARQLSGGTYYGVMEMSGNVAEIVVAASNHASLANYAKVWGNGELSASGTHDVSAWPAVPAPNTQYNPTVTVRGGSWAHDTAWNSLLRVSSRADNQWGYHLNTRGGWGAEWHGGRGLR